MVKRRSLDLGKDNIIQLIIKLCVPAVIAQIINFLYNLVDRIYVSNIAGIEMQSLSALGVVLPITSIIAAFANLVGYGGSPLATIKYGENKKQEADYIFNNSAVLLLIFGILIAVITFIFAGDIINLFGCPDASYVYAVNYLKIYSLGSVFVLLSLGLNPFITAQGKALIAMISVALGALLNIVLDPLFIFVFDMKVDGAALATVISQAASFVFIICFFFSKGALFKFDVHYLKLKWSYVYKILLLGLSPFIMQVTEAAIQIVFNVNLKMYSLGDENYTAAMTVMLSALQVISLPLNGLGYGIQPFISYNYGSGQVDRIKKGLKYIVIIAFIFAFITWLLSLLYPVIYTYIFNCSDIVASLVVKYTPIFLMGTIMFFAQMTLQNVNIALNEAKVSIFLALFRKVILLIPLCFILSYFFGVQGVFYSEGIADLVAGTVTMTVIFIRIPRLLKRRVEQIKKEHEALIDIH